jgi:hypothetical protein
VKRMLALVSRQFSSKQEPNINLPVCRYEQVSENGKIRS